MTRLTIRGARVLDPATGLDQATDIHIADGRIAALGGAAGFTPETVIDAGGLLAIPGLVDLCARLREPGAEHKADIRSEAAAAVAGGITTLVCPPDTDPVLDTPSVAELIHGRAQQAATARVLPLGALTLGLAGEHLSEMSHLHDAGCVGFSDGGRPVASTLVLRRALEYAASFALPVLLTPTDPWLASLGGMHEGPVATRLGLHGVPEAAETAGLARALAVARELDTPVHFGRLSCAQGVALLEQARRQGQSVTSDAAIHQLFLTEEDCAEFDCQAHVQPPLRGAADRDALRRALAGGGLTALCSDHQPHDSDAKDGPFAESAAGISGLDSLLALVLQLGREEPELGLAGALAAVTCQPADCLGLPCGRLSPGAPADLCLVDPDERWILDPDRMASRGRNTPFAGRKLQGRARLTLVGGRVVFCRDTSH